MVFYFVVILSKQNDSFVTMNQHKPKKNCVKRFAAFSAQCLSLLFVLVSSCASSSYIAVYFFCDSFCSVLTTNTDFFPSSSLLSTWRYGERKKKRSEMRPNHCCVKKWKENIRPKKWWEIYFFPQFFSFGRLIKRYSKRFDTIMFSFCVGFSIFLFGLRLFVLLFFSFCHFLHSRKIHGFILTGYQMLAVFGVPNCCRCVRPLELSFSACIILTPNQIFHGCWFFYLLVLSLFSSRFAFSIQCLLSQWSEIDVRKKTKCGRI